MVVVASVVPILALLAANNPGIERQNRPLVSMFAIVIGLNESLNDSVSALRYADDDAVQNAQLMNQLGAKVILLTELDRDTKRLYPPLMTSVPTRATLSKALETFNHQIDQVHATGAQTALFVFYSGHGDVKNNQGYLSLKDGELWRDDLLAMIAQSRATVNHLIIDACKSYYAVFERGSSGQRRPLQAALVNKTTSLRPNTGVFLSTSSAADSHEWEALQAGIFSHELRSALRGAADLDLDGRLTYLEAGAFVWAANAEIENSQFRPAFFSRPPAQSNDLLLDLGQVQTDQLYISAGMEDHFFVEDHLGRRLVDVHPSAGQAVVLHLPRQRPLFVRRIKDQKEWKLPKGRQVHLRRLSPRTSRIQRRGALHAAFQKLFSRPFGPKSLQAFTQRGFAPEVSLARQTDYRYLRYGIGVSSAYPYRCLLAGV